MELKDTVKFYGAVGSRIKKLRESKRFSQEKLSKKSGLAQSLLSRIEAGERAASLISIIKIAEALRVTPGYVLKTEKNPTVFENNPKRLTETETKTEKEKK